MKNRKKKYILSTSCSKMTVGKNMCLCFSLVIPDVGALGFDNLDEQFEFFHEMIYNPKIIDGGFDQNEVIREKSVEQIYEEHLQPAYDEYNNRQKRKDRPCRTICTR